MLLGHGGFSPEGPVPLLQNCSGFPSLPETAAFKHKGGEKDNELFFNLYLMGVEGVAEDKCKIRLPIHKKQVIIYALLTGCTSLHSSKC